MHPKGQTGWTLLRGPDHWPFTVRERPALAGEMRHQVTEVKAGSQEGRFGCDDQGRASGVLTSQREGFGPMTRSRVALSFGAAFALSWAQRKAGCGGSPTASCDVASPVS